MFHGRIARFFHFRHISGWKWFEWFFHAGDLNAQEHHSPEWAPKGGGSEGFASFVVSGDGATAIAARKVRKRPSYDVDSIFRGIREGNRSDLARGITLIESRSRSHREMAGELLERCLPHGGDSIRLGITGVPGAGKSTFIENLGLQLCEAGAKVAVLAVDPSSSRSGGSLLGDKTRMEDLSRHPRAFIRPSPAGETLGGVASRTREAICLVEAAGYRRVLVETVGVGQSEVAVRTMVDFFLLLQIAGAGDELQGLKKGVVELADAIVVNKADGDNVKRARRARSEYEQVLHYLSPYTEGWKPVAMTASALDGTGLDRIWETVEFFVESLKERGRFEPIRGQQNVDWFRKLLREAIWDRFDHRPGMRERRIEVEAALAEGRLPVARAVGELLAKDGSDS